MPPAPRKTAAQQRAEAASADSMAVKFDGATYQIARDINLDVFEALSTVNDAGQPKNQDYYKAVQCLLGVKQWQAWRAKHSTSSELMEFMRVATEAVGAGK